MAAGDLVTNDFEVEFNGVLAGEGTTFGIEVISKDLFSSPTARLSQVDRPLDHGAFVSAAHYPGYSFTCQYEVWGSTTADLANKVEEAMKFSSLTEDEIPLVTQIPHLGKVRYECKAIKRTMNAVAVEWATGYFTVFTVEYYATNPRMLSNTLNSAALSLSTDQGGLAYDLTYPLSYSTGGGGGATTINVTNAGSFETRPYFDVYGPLTSFQLVNETTGKTLDFNNGPVNSSTFVRVDFLDRTVLLNGTASRAGWVTNSGGWWNLQPGTNTIRFNGSSTGSPTATIYWRSAWL